MAQNLPTEILIQILTEVLDETCFEYFASLRRVCTKWNKLIPIIINDISIPILGKRLLLTFDMYKYQIIKAPIYHFQTNSYEIYFDDKLGWQFKHPRAYDRTLSLFTCSLGIELPEVLKGKFFLNGKCGINGWIEICEKNSGKIGRLRVESVMVDAKEIFKVLDEIY
ncbi:12241_t:CDS:2 [Gigaspora rosea]|nr:12241_t:CDS:2 [Gigaspora rosea]